jgi:hypothetical protein
MIPEKNGFKWSQQKKIIFVHMTIPPFLYDKNPPLFCIPPFLIFKDHSSIHQKKTSFSRSNIYIQEISWSLVKNI